MKLLLDTHTLLWFLAGDARLGNAARSAIEDPANTRLFSVAGAWEMAIKASLGKLSLAVAFEDVIPGQLAANGIELLPIRTEHVCGIIQLPFHHRDPFDRMLVAQARTEGAVLVSVDAALDAYGIPRLW